MPTYPHIFLLLLEVLVVNCWRGQLPNQHLGLLKPRTQLFVGLPELVDQDLGPFQASVPLRVEVAGRIVLLQKGLGLLLWNKGRVWGRPTGLHPPKRGFPNYTRNLPQRFLGPEVYLQHDFLLLSTSSQNIRSLAEQFIHRIFVTNNVDGEGLRERKRW